MKITEESIPKEAALTHMIRRNENFSFKKSIRSSVKPATDGIPEPLNIYMIKQATDLES
jgi:hypothetical protein